MNGHELLRNLRAVAVGASIPIVFLTARTTRKTCAPAWKWGPTIT